jgi:glutathione peroxidase
MDEIKNIYNFSCKNLNGEEVSLSSYSGKALLIVNTASKCGFTPQYKGLQELYEEYSSEGFEVLGFPCNQFGSQEPGTEQEIEKFCKINYAVTFPLFSKIEVNGPSAHPLFKFLTSSKPGLLGTKAIKWNFTKFLISRDGEVLKRFAPSVKPSDIATAIEAAL